MRISQLLAASTFVLALSVPASADVIFFTSSDWSETNPGVQVTAGPCGTPCTLSWSSTDGYGVNSWLGEDDEVNFTESLSITFSPGTTLYGFQILNLFPGEFGMPEMGAFRVNGTGNWTGFAADSRMASTIGLRPVSRFLHWSSVSSGTCSTR